MRLDDHSLSSSLRFGLVLSAGGLRGGAHVGVLRALVRAGLRIDILVGASAGAIVAAYYAAAGLTLDELAADAVDFRGRHLLFHALNIQTRWRFDGALGAHCGIIPERLRQLESARFDRLHHGITRLGIVCHDVRANVARYFATGADHGVALPDVAKASASIPVLFPRVDVLANGERWVLTDGGVSDPVPILFARDLGATHVVVSDTQWFARRAAGDDRRVWIRPRMAATGTLWTERGLSGAVARGEAAVTPDVLASIRRWGG